MLAYDGTEIILTIMIHAVVMQRDACSDNILLSRVVTAGLVEHRHQLTDVLHTFPSTLAV